MRSERDGATIAAALAAAIGRLRLRGDEARYDATLLLAAALERDPAWLLAHADDRLDAPSAERFAASVLRRERGEPVPYILGSAGFYGRLFAVDASVLVPRPETEAVVAAALAHMRQSRAASARLCDVGTGSGIIAITLACELPRAHVTAIDVSPEALATARVNARRHDVASRVAFVLGDGLRAAGEERFVCIVANLPYVRSADVAAAPDPTSFEPRLALDGGPDGLALYRRLLRDAPARLEPGGALIMEAGPDTVPPLVAEAVAAFPPAESVRVERDFAGLERLVIVRVRA
ncbi:MAG: peptide chain release factor N(5)-glutamine methyltransferase [Candidatus Eremiobacteraeota bacterium]|nr:peptide chain release factor N(5)-glutamine methyltransferase [Candidatus Eremiobacteraeota bacterium]